MTREEKAKAYDEALKKIKVLQEDWKSTHNRAWKEIEEVFPQLAESEDEKIRKWLYDYIERVGRTWGKQPFHYEQILAWLEKQKEQKPDWGEEDEMIYQHCKTILHDYGYDDWFKSLRPQPKQERSEEKCPHYSEGYGCEISPMKKCESCEKRPRWKPSEEQKEALEYAIHDYRRDSCNATANHLQEILDHLKNM